MDVEIDLNALADEMRRVTLAVPKSDPPIPVLANVLLEADDHGLHLSSTNLQIAYQGMTAATVHKPGRTTLPARRLMQLIEQCSDKRLVLSMKKNQVHVRSADFASQLQTLTAEDFPTLPKPPRDAQTIVIPRVSLQVMIDKIRHAVGKADKRFQFNGAQLELLHEAIVNGENQGPTMALVATDGLRIAIAASPAPTLTASRRALLPAPLLDALTKMPSEGDPWRFTESDNHLFFADDRTQVSSRKLTGEFPIYRRALAPLKHMALVDRHRLAAALRRIALLADESERGVLFTFADHQLRLHGESQTVGAGDEMIPATLYTPTATERVPFEGSVTLALIPRYVLDFLNVCDHQTVSIGFTDELTQTRWTDAEQSGSLLEIIQVVRA